MAKQVTQKTFEIAKVKIINLCLSLESSGYRHSKSFDDVIELLDECLYLIKADHESFIEETK